MRLAIISLLFALLPLLSEAQPASRYVFDDFKQMTVYQGRWNSQDGSANSDVIFQSAKFDLVSPWFGRLTDDENIGFYFRYIRFTNRDILIVPYFMGSQFAEWPSDNFHEFKTEVLEDPSRFLYLDDSGEPLARKVDVNPNWPDNVYGYYKIHDEFVRCRYVDLIEELLNDNPFIDGIYFDNIWDRLSFVGTPEHSYSGYNFKEIASGEMSREEFDSRYKEGWRRFFIELRDRVGYDPIFITNGWSKNYSTTNGRTMEGIVSHRSLRCSGALPEVRQKGFCGPFSIPHLVNFSISPKTGFPVHIAKYFSQVSADRADQYSPIDEETGEMLLDTGRLNFVVSASMMVDGMYVHFTARPQAPSYFMWDLKGYVREWLRHAEAKYIPVGDVGPPEGDMFEPASGIFVREFQMGFVICNTVSKEGAFWPKAEWIEQWQK